VKGSFSSIGFLLVVFIASAPLPLAAQKAGTGKVARGQYLVEKVALCANCHTPVNEKEDADRSRWLQGSALAIQPVRPNPNWAYESAKIAGLPGWTDADAIRFLQTGLDPNGYRARPPMPQYRLPREDAEAIVAYLKTLGNGGR